MQDYVDLCLTKLNQSHHIKSMRRNLTASTEMFDVSVHLFFVSLFTFILSDRKFCSSGLGGLLRDDMEQPNLRSSE